MSVVSLFILRGRRKVPLDRQVFSIVPDLTGLDVVGNHRRSPDRNPMVQVYTLQINPIVCANKGGLPRIQTTNITN